MHFSDIEPGKRKGAITIIQLTDLHGYKDFGIIYTNDVV